MANNRTLDQLLFEMGIDLSPVERSADRVKAVLNSINEYSDRVKASASSTAEQEKEKLGEIKTLAQAMVELAARQTAAERGKIVELRAGTAEFQKQRAEAAALNEVSRSGIINEQQKLAAIKAQTASIQQQIAAQRLANVNSGGGGGLLRRGVAGIGGAFLGSAAGSVLGAAVGGGIAVAGIEAAINGIDRFMAKLKEASTEGSKLTIVQDQFERVAKAAGIDASSMIDKMKESTIGLVSRLDLMKTATTALRSPFKLTEDQIVSLTGSVVKLAEANGKTSEQAIQALNRAFATGQARILAQVTGISRLALMLDRLPPSMGRVSRGAAQMQYAFHMITVEAEKLGEIPMTIEQMESRLGVAAKDLMSSFGRGVNLSAGMQTALTIINQLTHSLSSLNGSAFDAGKKVGDIFSVIAASAQAAVPTVKALLDLFFGLVGIGARLTGISDSTTAIAKSGGDAVDKFKALNPVLFQILSTFLLLNEEVKDFLGGINTGIERIKNALPWEAIGRITGAVATAGVSGFGGVSDRVGRNMPRALGGIKGALYGGVSVGTGGLVSAINDIMSGRTGASLGEEKADNQSSSPLDRAQAAMKQFAETYMHAQEMLDKARSGITRPEVSESQSPALKLREAQAQMQAEIALAKDRLAAKKADIEEEKYLDTERYKSAEESLATHLAKQRQLAAESRDAQKQENLQTYKSQLAENQAAYSAKTAPYGSGTIPAEVAQTHQFEVQRLTEQFHTKNIEAERQYQHQINSITKEGNATQLAEAKKQIASESQLSQDGIKLQQELADKQFAAGQLGATEYYSKRVALAEQLAKSEIDAAQATYEASIKYGNGAEAAQTRQLELAKALASAEKTLSDIQQAAGQQQYTQIQKQTQPQQQALQRQLEYQKSVGANPSTQLAIMQQMNDATVRERDALQALMSSGSVAQFSDLWQQIAARIEQTYDSQLKLNDQIRQMRDLAAPLGQLFGGVANTIGENFHSKFAQNLASGVGAGAKGLENSNNLGIQIAKDFGLKGADGTVKKDPATLAMEQVAESNKAIVQPVTQLKTTLDKVEAAIRDLIAQMGGKGPTQVVVVPVTGQNVTVGAQQGQQQPISYNTGSTSQQTTVASGSGGGTGSAQDAVSQWTNGIMHSLQAVTSFTASILSAKSALGGAAGGAIGGAGLGKTVSSALGIAGPIGQIAGAVGGAALGAILGQKNAQVTSNIHQFEDSYKQIMNQFALNTNNLNNTIIALQGLVNQIAQMQANSKKGSSQYQQLIDQYNQEIISLEQQQNQVIINMKEMAAIASAPVGAQSGLQGIQSIVQQYEQYIGAIQTVQQLEAQGMTQQQAQTTVLQQQATAYQYLTDSIQTYETNLQNQLLQDQAQAIQDALQLQDLLYQQTQDMLNFNNQVESVLSQGVLTRQLTRAQSAGQQIEQMTVAYQMQMDQLNEEISAEQFKVSAESQIFSLATTRIGLENQLLAAQNAQTTYSMQQIAALQALVTQIQSGNYQSGALGALLGAIPGVQNGATSLTPLQILQGLAGLLGVVYPGGNGGIPDTGSGGGGNTSGANLLDSFFGAAYQSRGSMGFAQFRGTGL